MFGTVPPTIHNKVCGLLSVTASWFVMAVVVFSMPHEPYK